MWKLGLRPRNSFSGFKRDFRFRAHGAIFKGHISLKAFISDGNERVNKGIYSTFMRDMQEIINK